MNKDLSADQIAEGVKMEEFWHKEHESGRKIAHDHSSPPKYKENVDKNKTKTKEDRAERFYDLLDENIKLKTHQSVLDGELTKMNTRLQRIKEMIARERRLNGGNFGKGFDKQIDEIIDENTDLTSENRKLRTVVKGLKNRISDLTKSQYLGSGSKRLVTTQYRSTRRPGSKIKRGGKTTKVTRFAPTKNLSDDFGNLHDVKDKDLMIQRMKESLKTGDATIHTLRNQLEKRRDEETKLKELVHDLRDQLDDKEHHFQRMNNEMKMTKSSNNKNQDELSKKSSEVQTLRAQLAMYESTRGTADENKKYVQEIIRERDDLQSKLTSLLTDPFFRREAGNEVSQRMHHLEDENSELRNELQELKEAKIKQEEELHKIRDHDEYKYSEGQDPVGGYPTRYPFKMGENVDLEEMKKALMSMDPTVFRMTMDQLSYDGDEPIWAKMDFLEQMGADPTSDKNDPHSTLRRLELMKQDKRDLAAALEKCQQILKLQYDIERDNKTFYETEAAERNTKIRELSLKLDETRKLADQRLEEITIMKKTGFVPRGEAAAQEADRLDADSEFSLATLETDLKHEENILDLALDKAEYYHNSLLQVVESDVVTEKGFLSFFTVEFYDHDTKATDVTTGLQPAYSTLFSFKNKVDDYYIQYLQSHRVKLELFLNKSQRVKKIGFANIVLRELIERDYDTPDGMKSPVITGIINIMSSANPALRIGSIKYKMRMRKSLNEALRWFREKNDLNVAQRPKRVTHQYLTTKVIAINIIRCTDLKSRYATSQERMQPFFFYNFYTNDEYFSKTGNGANPEFNDIQTYSTEMDSKFKDYTEEKTLEISILDDSVNIGNTAKEIDRDHIDDMIGVAHIPLFDLARGRTLWDNFVIKDYNGEITGMIEIKISVHNSVEEMNMPQMERAELAADDWGKEFLFKV